MAKIEWDDRTNSGIDSEVSASIFNDTKTSVNTLYDIIEAQTGNTGSSSTGSQFISGTIYISSSIIPNTAPGETVSSFSLGRPNSAWSEIYVSDGSINFVSGSNISSFTKAELDSIKEGKSASTGSKGGIGSGSWITTQAIFSEGVDTSYFRLGSDRIYTSIGSNLLLDLTGSQVLIGLSGSSSTNELYGNLHVPSGSIEITGSLVVKGNSPAILSFGDIVLGDGISGSGGGIFAFNPQQSENMQGAVASGNSQIWRYNDGESVMHTFANLGYQSKISGSNSLTTGFETIAGYYSHAEGHRTTTNPSPSLLSPIDNGYGIYSHAEGSYTTASAFYSHAEGLNTLTTGSSAGGQHAEGKQTIASGEASHAEGRETIAYGSYAHTEGFGTIVAEETAGSHAEGLYTIASGSAQHVQGKYNTHNNTTSLMIIGNGISDGARSDLALFNSNGIEFKNDLTASLISASGALYAAIPEDTNSSGINVVVYNPTTGQFEYTGSYSSGGGGGEDTDWYVTADNLNVTSSRNVVITGSLAQGQLNIAGGSYSHAQGYDTVTNAGYSHAEGNGTVAGAEGSHAEGLTTKTDGVYSHTEGRENRTLGNYSHAEGYLTTASGQFSHTEGESSTATGVGSHAEGNTTISSGSYSHAEGANTLAAGLASHTEGQFTTSSFNYSHAEGYNTHASGSYTHTEGFDTFAFGRASHAEGSFTSASGEFSHAEGTLTQAIGDSSHAQGFTTLANGQYSFAAGSGSRAQGTGSFSTGDNTIAQRDYSTAVGKFTKFGDVDGIGKINEALFIVSNGTNDGSRKNIVVINTSSIFLDAQSLPTEDPEFIGQVWRDGVNLKISLG
jgi:hypothetical protein